MNLPVCVPTCLLFGCLSGFCVVVIFLSCWASGRAAQWEEDTLGIRRS
jgi:hypothetical protein